MKTRGVICGMLVMSTLSGCAATGFGSLYNAPLPGGAELGAHPYRVNVQFADVLDLVPQAAVKVNDVPVGRIENIGLSADNTTADVTLVVNGDVRMPANADARLRQSSLLGEKFVELSPPGREPARGDLRASPKIPLTRTNRNPQIEEVLGALSMLLNGGGVDQLQTIVRELNKTLSGNEGQVRGLLSQLNDLSTRMDRQKENIVRAIDGLNRLSSSMRAQNDNLATGLRDLGPGLKVIDEQRGQLVAMLQSLSKLSGVATDTVNRSRDDVVADLRALAPTLQKLNEVGRDLPTAIGYLTTYPFPRIGPQVVKGDFANVDVVFDMNLSTILNNITRSSGPLVPIAGVNDGAQPAVPLPPSAPPPAPMPPPPPPPQSGGLLGGLLGGS